MTEAIKKGVGVNPAEKYLIELGTKSFLSLWSYPNVYHAPGKELADLLVVCGNDVLIFQDKLSAFPQVDDIKAGWKRWFKRTIASGANQVWGAERTLRNPATSLYLDAACKIAIPIPLPPTSEASFHLIVVTHGGSPKCRELFGGSGSFMIHTDLTSIDKHTEPFTVGDLNPARAFVHVWDDTTLNILMRTLDTITDFTSYLRKKEALLRGPMLIAAAGEEELLANYLKNMNDKKEHDFDFGIPAAQKVSHLAVPEGGWTSFIRNPQRLAQREQNRISYLWDRLIEQFNKHAIEGTQYTLHDPRYVKGVGAMEEIVRFMAKESRFHRRVLASMLQEMLETTPPTQRRLRITFSTGDVHYVFLLFPIPPPSWNKTYEEYRVVRAKFLEGACMVAKLKFPDAQHIVGIATESGMEIETRSEDAMYLDVTKWTPEMHAAAQEFQHELGVLENNAAPVRLNAKEYPEVVSREEFLKNPRNKPCPCGSGKKYKKCCEPTGRTFYK